MLNGKGEYVKCVELTVISMISFVRWTNPNHGQFTLSCVQLNAIISNAVVDSFTIELELSLLLGQQ